MRSTFITALTICTALAMASSAVAVVPGARVLDGPSSEIFSVGGSAMAADGTGGVVWLKRVNGQSRVFASRYDGQRFGPPMRVDFDLPFNSAWPRIAAGVGGRLTVVFAHEVEQKRRWLFGATLEPGADGFTSPVEVDSELGEAEGLFPQLAMNDAGRGYVAYRVVTDGQRLRGGDVPMETRVARVSGRRWSRIGQVNRRPGLGVAAPTAENAPKVAIDREGDGFVAFQEPDDELVDRIYGRRLFGGTAGRILRVSPSQFNGRPLRGAADQLSAAGSDFAVGAVAFRQQPGPNSPLKGTRIMVNTLPWQFEDNAAEFRGAELADGAGGGSLGGVPSVPDVAVDPDEGLSVGFSVGQSTLLASGELGKIAATRPLRAPEGAGPAGSPQLAVGPGGPLTSAWPVQVGPGANAVAIQEDPLQSRATQALVSAPIGGPVTDLTVAGSDLGDALVAFRQGAGPDTQVVAAEVDVAPRRFELNMPDGWIRPGRARIGWDRAVNAGSAVTYRAVLDGQRFGRQSGRRRVRFPARRLGDGPHSVQVIARDRWGQETASRKRRLRVDGAAPRGVRIRRRGRRVTVRVLDGARGRSSGIAARRTIVRLGDGARRKGRSVRHRYKRAGRFRVTVRAVDRAGNKRTFSRLVTVR